MSKDMEMQLISPFSVYIAKIKIPDIAMQKMLELTDKILEKKEENWGENLVGQIENEWLISDAAMKEHGLNGFVTNIANAYVGEARAYGRPLPNRSVRISSAWVNEMEKYEYNPLHFHTECLLSSVLFLKLPDLSKSNISKKNHHQRDGLLEFASHAPFPTTGDAGQYIVRPEVGDFYIFPAGLLHTVYPFNCDGVRRSVAFNFA